MNIVRQKAALYFYCDLYTFCSPIFLTVRQVKPEVSSKMRLPHVGSPQRCSDSLTLPNCKAETMSLAVHICLLYTTIHHHNNAKVFMNPLTTWREAVKKNL